MEIEKCIPIGDKVVLEGMPQEQDASGVVLAGGMERTRVVAVGPGIPYGRGEFYAPFLKPGMIVLLTSKIWGEAERLVNHQGRQLRIVHERQCSIAFEE
jgi:co-chaperonin GroES (HSP10)